MATLALNHMIANTAIIYPNVELGNNIIIEDNCIIGAPVSGANVKTVIGDNAHIRANTIIYAGNVIGSNFVTGNHVNIREHNNIGNNVSIGTSTIVEHHICFEDNVRVHSAAFIPEFSHLKEGCWIGPAVVLTNAKYPKSPNVKATLKGPTIGKGAKLGANSTILPGIVICDNALIGAGSVVTADVEEGFIVAGNPAKKLRKIHY